MKVSLAETLAIVAWIALNLAGLLSHESVSWLAIFVNFVMIIAFMISALVAAGPHRAFSIAFLVPVVLYLGIVVTNSRNELSYGYGKLPTSRFFQVFLEQENDHLSSGEIIKERQARAESLMPCGHAAVAVLLGYVAGKYGRAVYGWTRRAEGQIARG